MHPKPSIERPDSTLFIFLNSIVSSQILHILILDSLSNEMIFNVSETYISMGNNGIAMISGYAKRPIQEVVRFRDF